VPQIIANLTSRPVQAGISTCQLCGARGGVYLSEHMIHSTTVSLPPRDVLARAKLFFAERVPNAAAFVEREGSQFVVLRGQGGEELVISAWTDPAGATRVRASTLFFDQALDRFFSTLPLVSGVEVA
jgi:hypothetical protein